MSTRGRFASLWVRVFAIWTMLVALLMLPQLPGALRSPAPCARPGEGNSSGLPPCPMDDANYAAIGVFLLLLLWAFVVILGLAVFAIQKVWKGLRDSA